MAKVTLRAEVKLDEDDYNKIIAFADKNDKNPELKNISKLMENVLEFNFNNILAQIAAAEAAEKAQRETSVEAKVMLYGVDGKPLIAPGDNGDG